MGVVGIKEAADAMFAAGHADDDLVLHGEGGSGDGVAFHGVRNLGFPEWKASAGVQADERGIKGADKDAVAEHGDAAIKSVALERVDDLLLALVLPDLHAGAGVEGEDLAGHAGGVHDAVDDDGG